MGKPNEIAVELRLVYGKLRDDIRKATENIRSGLSSDMVKNTGAIKQQADAMDNLDRSTRRANLSLKDRLEMIRRGNLGPDPKISINTGGATSTRFGIASIGHQSRIHTMLQPTLPSMTMTAARPPVIPPPVIPGGGGGGGAAAGGFGGANWLQTASQIGSVVTGVVAAGYAIRRVLNFLLEPLRRFADGIRQAVEAQRQLYARTLQSGGLPMGFMSQRATLASVIGVSEDEVFQFGRAVQFLNEKVRFAHKTFAETNSVLTNTGWSMRTLGLNFEAAFARIAEAMAPFLQQVSDAISGLIKLVVESDAFVIALHFLKTLLFQIQFAIKGVIIAFEFFLLQVQILVDLLKFNWGGDFSKSKKMLVELNERIKSLFEYSATGAPPVSASLQRFPTSPWEKMGLIIGQGGAGDSTKQIAHNTKRTADLLDSMAKSRVQRSGALELNPVFAQP